MSRFIPVEPEKWAEMVKAQADLPRWKEMCDELDARCNELKAENERLRHLANQSEFYRTQLQKDTCRLENIQMQDAFKHYETENARLKAEVQRLTQEYSDATNHYNKLHNDLQAKVNNLHHQLKLCGEIEVLAFVSTGKSILPEIFEIARLKAEVERLRSSSFVTAVPCEEYDKLKAENERLKKFNDEAMAHIAKEERKARMRQEGLEAENERLRKAGDALAEGQHWLDVEAWNAAKDGKPTE